MALRTMGAAVWWVLLAAQAGAQSGRGGGDAAWRSADAVGAAVQSSVQASPGSGTLPNEHGQVWREYDIRPYTSRVTTTARPEQAIVDWILRETGVDVWFSEPLGLLSANHDVLRVYHTPEMQRLVRDLVDRFVSSEAESHVFGVRLITIGNPNWRSLAHPLMRPVEVQTPGVEAWLLTKENAAVLLGELAKRTDYQEHGSPNLLIHNGQSYTMSRMRPRNFVRDVRVRKDGWPGHDLVMGQVQEGFTLEISPLMSRDGLVVDAAIKCHIDQVERLAPVLIDVPAPAGGRPRVQIQVPQMVSWRLHERFRWPADKVLLVSCGVVATPGPAKPAAFGLLNPFGPGPGRADALLFLESKGKASQTLLDEQRTAAGAYRGRY